MKWMNPPKTLKPQNSFNKSIIYNSFLLFLKSRAAFHRWRKNKSKLWKKAAKSVVSIEHKQFDCKKSAGIRVVSCVWPPGEAPSHSIHWGRPPTKREEHTKNPHFFSTFLSQWFSKIGKMVFFQGVLFHFLNEWWISEEQVA